MTATADRAPALRFPIQVLVTAVAAVTCAYASMAVVHFSTPIDDALPLAAVILCMVAAVSSPVIVIAVPLLMGGEIAIADERTRLLWFGAVIAASFAAAMLSARPRFWRGIVVTAGAVALLRWIPLRDLRLEREILLLLFALAIAAVLRFTPVAVAIAVATALFTPAVPLRTFAIPLAVLLIAGAIGAFRLWREAMVSGFHRGAESISARLESLLTAAAVFMLALMLTFFAWSGAFARALPVVWRGIPQAGPLQPIGLALAPGEQATVEAPANARALIVSGANVAKLPRGTVVGTIEPGGRVLRIGEVVDWGSLRREQFFAARNRIPRDPAGRLRGYGYEAWIDGASRVALGGERVLRVTVDRALPADVRLQVQYFELERE